MAHLEVLEEEWSFLKADNSFEISGTILFSVKMVETAEMVEVETLLLIVVLMRVTDVMNEHLVPELDAGAGAGGGSGGGILLNPLVQQILLDV